MTLVGDLIADRLRELREKKGLKVADLADATVLLAGQGKGRRVSERLINLIEAERGRVSDADVIESLAAALDVDAVDLAPHEYPIAVARREAASTPEAAAKREADALRKAAQRRSVRPAVDPETTQPSRRRTGEGG